MLTIIKFIVLLMIEGGTPYFTGSLGICMTFFSFKIVLLKGTYDLHYINF